MAIKFGLVASSGKYLTTDFDGKISLTPLDSSVNKLNTSQIWMLETDPNGEDSNGPTTYSFYSTNGHYLTVGKSGTVTADAEKIGDAERFVIDAGGGGSGGWLISSAAHETFLGIKSRKVLCKKREASSSDQRWYVRLLMHPHCSLYNDAKKCYARVQFGRLAFDIDLPWRHDALFQLCYSDGYGYFRVGMGQYLTREGKLDNDISHQCLFVLEVTGDRVRLKDYTGLYLSVNTRGRLFPTTGKERASFSLCLNYPHVSLQRKVKGTWMKIRCKEGKSGVNHTIISIIITGGVDLSANLLSLGGDAKLILQSQKNHR